MAGAQNLRLCKLNTRCVSTNRLGSGLKQTNWRFVPVLNGNDNPESKISVVHPSNFELQPSIWLNTLPDCIDLSSNLDISRPFLLDLVNFFATFLRQIDLTLVYMV